MALSEQEVAQLRRGPVTRSTSPVLTPPPSFEQAEAMIDRSDPRLLKEHQRLKPNENGRAMGVVPPPPPNSHREAPLPLPRPVQIAQPMPINDLRYPAWRYHANNPAGLVVHSEIEDKALGAGWVDSRSKLPQKVSITVESRLATLDTLLELLGSVAVPTDTPIGALEKLIEERDAMALRLARISESKEDKQNGSGKTNAKAGRPVPVTNAAGSADSGAE